MRGFGPFSLLFLEYKIIIMTAKKDIFNIKPSYTDIALSMDKELKEYYERQKREYLLKYNLSESHIKTNKPKTALEIW